jgi:hypothetical protein
MMKQTTIFRSAERCLTTLLDQTVRIMTPGILTVILLTATLLPATTASGQNSETVEHEAGFYYTVKKGDTLWDLSQRFSDSPWLWPDLWQKNGQIANPHRIFPGERIRIYHKDWIERMRKAPEEPAPEEAAPEPVEVVRAPEPAPVAAPPTPSIAYAAIDSVGFIRKHRAGSFGSIFKTKDDKELISQGDLVYINPDAGTLEEGSRYTIFRTLDALKDKQTKELIGIQHNLLGIVEILAIEEDFALGDIYRSFESIKIGDQLMNYIPGDPKISLTRSVKGLKGRIIAAKEGEILIGDHMLVFVDKGSDDGVARGQRYLVYEQKTGKVSARSKKILTLPPIDYGTLLILHVEVTTATALVTSSAKNIAPGDAFRAP